MPLVESDYLPPLPAALFPGPWLVFAPHPDDETYGMGGSIAAARAAGIRVEVVVVTDGALGGEGDGLIATREREVNAAVAILGGTGLSFWRVPDRHLQPDERLIALAAGLLDASAGGTVFFPSPVEPHPDHRATAVLVWEALRRRDFPLTATSYEISVQGPCNRLIDITPWVATKRLAMAVYASQEAERPYADRILALNQTRAWSLPPGVEYAEAFCVHAPKKRGLAAILAHFQHRDIAGVTCDNLPGAHRQMPILMPEEVERVVKGRDAAMHEAEKLREELNQILSSRSWRLTAPLRKLARRIRGEVSVTEGSGQVGDAEGGAIKPALLVVLATNTVGGAEIQTHNLLQGLVGQFTVTVLTHVVLESLFADLRDGHHPDQGRLDLVFFESRGLTNPFDYRQANLLAYARAIAVTARDTKAVLIHGVMHNSSLFIALAYWRHYRTLRRRTLVGSLHGSLNGYFAQRGQGATRWEWASIRLALATLDAVITPSQGVARELVTSFGGNQHRVHAIHNGFRLEQVRQLGSEPLDQPKTEPWILTCCRLSDQKDFKTLIAAFGQLKASPLPRLLIVGEGLLEDQIRAWADQYGVAERIELVGFQHNPFNWMRQAEIFVLSSHYEGFGNVIIEALALGVPVAASDCPWGPGEIIENGRNGALFPPGDAAALARILEGWLADPAERARLGQAGQARAAYFTAERMAGDYANLFRKITARRMFGWARRATPKVADRRVGVLIFHPANVFGGAERTIVNLLSHLRRERVRVVLVGMPEVFRDPAADVFYSLAANGLDPGGFSTVRQSVVEARRIIAIARREQCQVMLGMLHYGAIIAGLCWPLSWFRLKTIASPRTPSVAGIRFHAAASPRVARLWRTLIWGFCHLASRVLVASAGLKQECVEVFGAKASRVRVIPNSVDDGLLELARHNAPRARECASPEAPWLIVSAGRLAPEKDIDTLIRALALLRNRQRVRLEIIGTGPQSSQLAELAATLGVAEAVDFTGFTPNPLDRMRQADVVVHTGLFEGFGNSLLEAMASGVPLIATDCDFGPREIVKEGVNGVLVPVADPQALADALESLLLDPKRRLRLAEQGLKDVQNYRAELMANRYEEVFCELGQVR